MLTKEEVQKYKERLQSDRAQLVSDLAKEEKPTDFGSDVDSFEEEGSEAEQLGNQLGVAKVIRARINEIDSALNKIIEGIYGTCARCGKEIEKEVLNLVPESQLCEEHKKTA